MWTLAKCCWRASNGVYNQTGLALLLSLNFEEKRNKWSIYAWSNGSMVKINANCHVVWCPWRFYRQAHSLIDSLKQSINVWIIYSKVGSPWFVFVNMNLALQFLILPSLVLSSVNTYTYIFKYKSNNYGDVNILKTSQSKWKLGATELNGDLWWWTKVLALTLCGDNGYLQTPSSFHICKYIITLKSIVWTNIVIIHGKSVCLIVLDGCCLL